MKKLILLVLMLPMVALSDPQPWMKKDNPNELTAVPRLHPNCPITSDELSEFINGILIRSRIKPGSNSSGLHLYVDVQCTKPFLDDSFVGSIDVEFVSNLVNPSQSFAFRYDYTGYSSFGVGDKETLWDIVRDNIEDALTDYLKVNFDLGEDE